VSRRLIRDVSTVLILSGLLLILDAGVTLIWQEPVTAAIGLIKRGEIDRHLVRDRGIPLGRLDRYALRTLSTVGRRISFLARREQRQVSTADAIGSISIPKLGVSWDIVQGTEDATLQKGPGHYPSTAFPGLGQTVAIAGHRTTYLAPFRRLDELHQGDRIMVTMPYARFTYVVQKTQVVLPSALWVIKNAGYERLVLSACHPMYSASHRIIVFARLSGLEPLGAALTAA
jgi:sortase A